MLFEVDSTQPMEQVTAALSAQLLALKFPLRPRQRIIRIALSGGPASGKTAALDHLTHKCVHVAW